MKHDDWIEQIYALVDGILSPEEEQEINEHIAECEECRELYSSVVSDDRAIDSELEAVCSRDGFPEKVLASAQQLEQEISEKQLRHSIKSFIFSRRVIYAAAAVMVIITTLTIGISYFRERTSRFGRIAKLNGLAWCKRDGMQFIFQSGDIIRCNDEVMTENSSKMHIITNDHHIITLNANTYIKIGENNRVRQDIGLLQGEVFIDSNGSGRKYRIRAANTEIRNIGTKFDVRVMPAQLTPSIIFVGVESGKAVIDAENRSINVETGGKVVLVENHVEKLERAVNIEEIAKWRWNLKYLLQEPSLVVRKEKDPYTGRTWIAEGKRFVIPEDNSSEEYEVIYKLLVSMCERLGKPIKATSIAFAEDAIYIGTPSGIFRYNRIPRTVSLIVPDYSIVGSDITDIAISKTGDIFDISYCRQGSSLIEHFAGSKDSFAMILNFDPLTLQPIASTN
jgi:hypothetical protein